MKKKRACTSIVQHEVKVQEKSRWDTQSKSRQADRAKQSAKGPSVGLVKEDRQGKVKEKDQRPNHPKAQWLLM